MTTPRQARQSSDSGPRIYAWPPLPPHEFEVISVTSAKDVYPKPWLTGWAVKMTAERAVDKYAFLGSMIAEDPKGALKWLKDARWSSAGAKADRGTIVHSAIEAYVDGVTMDRETIQAKLDEKRVPVPLQRATFGMVEAVMQFFADEEPEVYWSESTVYSRAHNYAGTPDIVGRMRVGGKLVPVIIDFKTSKDIYDDVGLQLVAYSRADFVGMDDGTEMPLVPDSDDEYTDGEIVSSDEPIRHGVVVRPLASGKYELAHFDLTDELHDTFLHCLALATADPIVRGARRSS